MYLRHIYNHARNKPQKLAMVSSGQEISYLRLAQLIDHSRSLLIDESLPAGGVVAEMVNDLLGAWVLLLALRSLGRTTVSGSSWGMIEGLDLRDLRAVICPAGDQATRDAIARSHPECRIIEFDPRSLSSVSEDHAVPEAPQQIFGDHILCTSGTTGTYKKVVLKGDVLDHFVEHDVLGIGGRILSDATVHHNGNFGAWTIAGYRMPMMLWHVGATLVVEQRANGVEHFFDHPINCAVLLPPQVEKLCETYPQRATGATRLTIITGGGFISADPALRAARQLCCDVYVNYAGTEFMVALEAKIESIEDTIWLDPVEGQQVELVDEDDRPVPIGEDGIIRIRLLRSDPAEYRDDPDATSRHFRDGYFYPGDMAVMRSDGKVRVLGRAAEVLTLGGQKVAIEPIEQRARELLGVGNLCMFAKQTDGGKIEMLIVIEGDRLPARTKLDEVAAQASRHFSHTRFALLPEFPRGENGMMKINRREVRRLAG